MATYLELANLGGDAGYETFVRRIVVACAVKAKAIAASPSPTVAAKDWARLTLTNPRAQADQIVYYVLAANVSATIAQILAASDVTIQTNVDSAVDTLLGV